MTILNPKERQVIHPQKRLVSANLHTRIQIYIISIHRGGQKAQEIRVKMTAMAMRIMTRVPWCMTDRSQLLCVKNLSTEQFPKTIVSRFLMNGDGSDESWK